MKKTLIAALFVASLVVVGCNGGNSDADQAPGADQAPVAAPNAGNDVNAPANQPPADKPAEKPAGM